MVCIDVKKFPTLSKDSESIVTRERRCAPPSKRSFRTRVWDNSEEAKSKASAALTEEDAVVSDPWATVKPTPFVLEFWSIPSIDVNRFTVCVVFIVGTELASNTVSRF